MRTYWLVENLIAAATAAVIAAIVAAVNWMADASTAAWIVAVVGGVVVLALLVWALVTPRLRYEHYRYEVMELGLYVARGWLWRRWQLVPHARVQTVDTSAGPLLRAFGLVGITVTTASAAGSTSIPGLRREVADALVAELAMRAGIEEGT
jgi:membrane protein YdbS with pleckstrin-like domain